RDPPSLWRARRRSARRGRAMSTTVSVRPLTGGGEAKHLVPNVSVTDIICARRVGMEAAMASWPALLLREPARPPRIATAPWAPALVVGTVCIGAFMGQLDASIVSLALPAIGRDLHAAPGQTEWVALSYLLTLVSLVAPVGRLADTVGRKLFYTYGF